MNKKINGDYNNVFYYRVSCYKFSLLNWPKYPSQGCERN